MLKSKLVKMLFLLAVAGLAVTALRAAEEKRPEKVYRFMANLRVSWGGESAANIEALFMRIAEIVNARTGIKIELVPAKSTEEIFGELKDGKIHMAALESPEYIAAVKEGIPIRPVLNVAMKKKQNTEICVYVKKDSPDAEEFKNLRGKRVMLMGVYDWIYLQKYLFDMDEKEKVRDYFSRVILGNDTQSELYALIFGKTDAVISTESGYIMAARADKRFKGIEKLLCMGEYPNGPIVVHEEMDEKDMGVLKKLFLRMHRDKDFKEYHMFFIAANARFAKVAPEFYEPFRERIAAAREAGWIGDYEKWKEQQE